MSTKKPRFSKPTKLFGGIAAAIGFAVPIIATGYKVGIWFFTPYVADYQNTKREIHETANGLVELRATTQTRSLMRDNQLMAMQTWANGQDARLDKIDKTIKENNASLEQKMKDNHDETHNDINHLIDLIENRRVTMGGQP